MTPTTLGRFNSAQYVQAMKMQTGPMIQLGDASRTSTEWIWAGVSIGAVVLGVWAAFAVITPSRRHAR